MTGVTLPAHAKLNLTLDILRRRTDGYHDLQMVMQSISLHDDVTVTLTNGRKIACRCGEIPGDESNLAVQAARAFFSETGIPSRGLGIDIVKRIPVKAGMAGGSADGAAVLRALRTLLRPELTDGELERIGARVGSDVPYCIRGGTVLAEGRGERLTTLPDAPAFHAVLCMPNFAISTPMLFSRVCVDALTGRPDTEGMIAALQAGDPAGVLTRVRNVFETILPEQYDEVFSIKSRLLALGADAAAMTGSGSAVFGLYRDGSAAQAAFTAMSRDNRWTALAQFV